jgi:glycosyltransferase involved in cell wall biosynthesis
MVSRGDPDILAKRILTLLWDQPSAARMGDAGRTHAMARFDRERMLDELLAVCEEVR